MMYDARMKMTHTKIKCGNADLGVYLLDDIKERLNTRILNGSCATIASIKSDGLTWITVSISWVELVPEKIMPEVEANIVGMVTGILIWSGVEVI